MKRALPFFRRTMNITGCKRSALEVARGRLVLMSAFFALIYILVAARLVDLSLIQGQLAGFTPEVAAAPEDNGPDSPKMRADITDRNGVLLATSLKTASLYADPVMIPHPEQVARELVDTLPGLSYKDTLEKLRRKCRFIWLQRNLTPDEQFAVLKLGHPGLNFRTEYRRIYPQGPLTSHIVGYTGMDGEGQGGIERSFDPLLKSSTTPLRLTLDIRLQHILRREIMRAKKDFDGNAGTGVILDVSNGEILASVSLPDFDPQNPGAPKDPRMFNMMTQGSYELGSTFKIFSTAALLDSGKAPIGHMFDATKPLKSGRHTIHDFHPENRFLTIPEVFIHSSNIGAAQMGEMVGAEGMKNFFADLGFAQPLPLEISEIGKPRMPSPWRDIDTLTTAFGHGIAVSPLQMVAAAASIAGGGTLVRPTLILDRSRQARDGLKTDVRIVSPETSHEMRQLMRMVVTGGTAEKADVPGYDVGGKTGTADKASAGGYDRKRKLSSFLGFFPMEAPRYAVFILIDEPKPNKTSYGYATGGWVGAPAVGKVIAAMAPLLGLPPVAEKEQPDIAASLARYVHDEKKGSKPVASY